MPEPTLADLFAEARTLLEGKTVECAYAGYGPEGHAVLTRQPDDIDPCHAYDALRDVTKRKLIYWQTAPDKALEGALINAIGRYVAATHDYLHITSLETDASDTPRRFLSELILRLDDTRIPAMQAVVEWLRGEIP